MPRRKRTDEPQDEPIAALEAISSPVDEFLNACRELGVPREHAMGIVSRLAARKTDFVSRLDRLGTRDIIRKVEEKIGLVLHYLDEFAIAGASPRDLAIIFGIMVEKRQLLLGEPTQILSMQERKHINDLIPALLQEASHRGMTIDLTPGQYSEVGKEGRAPRVVFGEREARPRPMMAANRRMLAAKED